MKYFLITTPTCCVSLMIMAAANVALLAAAGQPEN